jgi:hypothetical protein
MLREVLAMDDGIKRATELTVNAVEGDDGGGKEENSFFPVG